jgi:hypothetical protein
MRRKTRSRVAAPMSVWLLNTLETVTVETPSSLAISFMRTAIAAPYPFDFT